MSTPTSSYELGQIVFILSNNQTPKVVPAIIEEVFLRKKLNGDVTTYKISIGHVSKRKIIDLDKVDGEIFSSLEEIRDALMTRLTDFVSELIETAEKRTKAWYESPDNDSITTATPPTPGLAGKINPEMFLESNSGGTTPSMAMRQQLSPTKIPLSLTPLPAQVKQQRLSKEEAIARLKNLAKDEDPIDAENMDEITMVDNNGEVKKVKINLNGGN